MRVLSPSPFGRKTYSVPSSFSSACALSAFYDGVAGQTRFAIQGQAAAGKQHVEPLAVLPEAVDAYRHRVVRVVHLDVAGQRARDVEDDEVLVVALQDVDRERRLLLNCEAACPIRRSTAPPTASASLRPLIARSPPAARSPGSTGIAKSDSPTLSGMSYV